MYLDEQIFVRWEHPSLGAINSLLNGSHIAQFQAICLTFFGHRTKQLWRPLTSITFCFLFAPTYFFRMIKHDDYVFFHYSGHLFFLFFQCVYSAVTTTPGTPAFGFNFYVTLDLQNEELSSRKFCLPSFSILHVVHI